MLLQELDVTVRDYIDELQTSYEKKYQEIKTSLEQEILIEKGDVKIHIPLILGRGEILAAMEGLGRAL